jgi:hypothetical protein
MPPKGPACRRPPPTAAEGLGLARYGYGWPGAFAFFGLTGLGVVGGHHALPVALPQKLKLTVMA